MRFRVQDWSWIQLLFGCQWPCRSTKMLLRAIGEVQSSRAYKICKKKHIQVWFVLINDKPFHFKVTWLVQNNFNRHWILFFFNHQQGINFYWLLQLNHKSTCNNFLSWLQTKYPVIRSDSNRSKTKQSAIECKPGNGHRRSLITQKRILCDFKSKQIRHHTDDELNIASQERQRYRNHLWIWFNLEDRSHIRVLPICYCRGIFAFTVVFIIYLWG